jgi:hypothetical protein
MFLLGKRNSSTLSSSIKLWLFAVLESVQTKYTGSHGCKLEPFSPKNLSKFGGWFVRRSPRKSVSGWRLKVWFIASSGALLVASRWHVGKLARKATI